jgi:hypothetical protein
MAKVICTHGITFGATGDTYEEGQEYEVPSSLVKAYPEHFKMAGRPANKAAETQENK